MTRHEKYATAVGTVFAGCAAHEAGRVIVGLPWGGFVPLHSAVVAALLASLWISSAVGLMLRERFELAARFAWPTSILGTFAIFAHGALLRLGGNWGGVVYMALALLTAFLLKRAYDRGGWRPLEDPAHGP